METGTIWPILVAASLLVGILICAAQFYLAVRIIRAKTDVPIFNQLFVICLLVSGWGYLMLGSLMYDVHQFNIHAWTKIKTNTRQVVPSSNS